jgi:hypothetical protein
MTSRGCRGNTSRNTDAAPPGRSTVTVLLASRRSAASAVSRRVSWGRSALPRTVPSAEIPSAFPAPWPSMIVATTSPPGPRAASRISGRTTGSTKTRIVPPQASPTAHASWWLTPNETSLGLPRSMAATISAAVAASTHPPDTDPATRPSLVASIAAPSGRGAEPHTLVTTARPTCRGPADRRSYAANRSRMTDAPGALTQPHLG